jgi:polyhydroxybutyrate depolymerase
MASRTSRIVVVIVVGVVIVGCIIAGVTYWMVGPSLQCMLPTSGPAQAGWSARTLVSGGMDRCYHLYVPTSYDPAQPVPLVVSYHGWLSNSNTNSALTGWSKVAEQEGFLVAFPQGTSFPQRWNSGPTWGVSDVDDEQFFLDLLDDLAATAAIDSERIYVNGFSNGGGMSVHLGCRATDRMAAMGSVAGAVVEMDDCSPTRPLPVMAFHGTADPLVPYEGGPEPGWMARNGAKVIHAPGFFVAPADWVAHWVANNGCDTSPETIPPQGDASGIRYTNCDMGAGVVFYTIEGGGHAWPGGMPLPFVGKTSKDIDATEELWAFFQEQSLAAE